jgi:Leu/Phe-tRNA-protein transferase
VDQSGNPSVNDRTVLSRLCAHDRLVGGLYGISIGGYFSVESQFSYVRDASKVRLDRQRIDIIASSCQIALVHLVGRLRLGGYLMLDVDEITTHLVQFGAYELPRAVFLDRAMAAMRSNAIWWREEHLTDVFKRELKYLVDGRRSEQKSNITRF